MATVAPATPVLLTANEVSALLGWSPDTTYRRVREGLLPAVKIGKRRFFHRDVVAEFLRAGGNTQAGA